MDPQMRCVETVNWLLEYGVKVYENNGLNKILGGLKEKPYIIDKRCVNFDENG